MEAIDQAAFNFDPGIGLIVGVMVGFLVFAVVLELLLVTCCLGGALSNYLTGLARGDVATPPLFVFWASVNPATRAVLQDIRMDPQRVVMTLLIMLIVPVTAGMLLRATRPGTNDTSTGATAW